jgi:hypothetical protein
LNLTAFGAPPLSTSSEVSFSPTTSQTQNAGAALIFGLDITAAEATTSSGMSGVRRFLSVRDKSPRPKDGKQGSRSPGRHHHHHEKETDLTKVNHNLPISRNSGTRNVLYA